ncbi:MAG: hypothetical protein ABI113_18755, partial [Mucilaginibacter sp.]
MNDNARGDTILCVAVDRLTAQIYPGRQQMGAVAAAVAAQKIIELLNQQPFVNIIFAAAPSQNEFLSALIQNKTIDWRQVNAFHMDEY